MKAFIFSILVIIALLISSSVYSVAICSAIDKMIFLSQSFFTNGDCLQGLDHAISEIQGVWDKNQILFRLFVDDEHYAACELALERLKDYSKSQNTNDFIYATSVFISSLRDIKNIESRDFFSIF